MIFVLTLTLNEEINIAACIDLWPGPTTGTDNPERRRGTSVRRMNGPDRACATTQR
jgi:hypothetical protein